jgi:hypothetical protein
MLFRSRLVAIVVAAFLSAGTIMLTTASAASADPGFCGVKVGTEVVPGGAAGFTVYYIVRNRCSQTLNFEAYDVNAPKTASYCLPINGGSSRGLPMGTHLASNWGVRICYP